MSRRKPSDEPKKAVSTEKDARIPKLPPSADDARDEGPRLIPLSDPTGEHSRLEHYLDLADAALKAQAEAAAETSNSKSDQPKNPPE
jgi:hypothetical protein